MDVYGCSLGVGPGGVRSGSFTWQLPYLVSGRYYADIRQTVPASDQEMNSILAELSRVRYGPPSASWVGHRCPAVRVLLFCKEALGASAIP